MSCRKELPSLIDMAFLIADDSQQKIDFLQSFLKHARWDGDVLIAHTTEEAMRLIDAHPDIGFAFIDYYIPSGNGPSVIRYLTEKNPSARIALVSSSDKLSNQTEAKNAGAETCICTSYEEPVVKDAILGLLEQWKAE